jgi:hypothetical protein
MTFYPAALAVETTREDSSDVSAEAVNIQKERVLAE